MPTISTLGRAHQATTFSYTGSVANGVVIAFQTANAAVSATFFAAIRQNFAGAIVAGGFSMTDPHPNGFGFWVQQNSALNSQMLTPRHASFIAAIMKNEGWLTSSFDGNAVILHFT